MTEGNDKGATTSGKRPLAQSLGAYPSLWHHLRDVEETIHLLLSALGWVTSPEADDADVDMAAWRGRRALHELAAVTGSDPGCYDDRDEPPPSVAYDLKLAAIQTQDSATAEATEKRVSND